MYSHVYPCFLLFFQSHILNYAAWNNNITFNTKMNQFCTYWVYFLSELKGKKHHVQRGVGEFVGTACPLLLCHPSLRPRQPPDIYCQPYKEIHWKVWNEKESVYIAYCNIHIFITPLDLFYMTNSRALIIATLGPLHNTCWLVKTDKSTIRN